MTSGRPDPAAPGAQCRRARGWGSLASHCTAASWPRVSSCGPLASAQVSLRLDPLPTLALSSGGVLGVLRGPTQVLIPTRGTAPGSGGGHRSGTGGLDLGPSSALTGLGPQAHHFL